MDAEKRDNSEAYRNRNQNEFTFVENTTGNEVILEYLKQKNVAAWYRGTSHFHIQGADKLFNALRDDGEQKTTHRVRTCLNLIGLKPMITSKQITFLMRLSRGNDLVFLWFLMEMHYKTPKHDPKSYSVNEQLICSAICHLDMVTTLRELDKILPRGHTSRLEMKRSGMQRQRFKESYLKQNRKKKNTSPEYVLPYFEKYPRLRHYGKRLYLDEPFFKVQLNFYGGYKNPNYVVQNESNRWYANYHFHAGKRIVHIIINETIRSIFYNAEEVSLRLKTTEVLCDYHKTLKTRAADLEHELRVNAKNECLKYYFGKNEDACKKIKDRLDKDVQQHLCKFKEQSKNLRKNSSLKTVTSDGKVFEVFLGSNEPFSCNCNADKNTNTNTNINKHTDSKTNDKVRFKDEPPKDSFSRSMIKNTNNYINNETKPNFKLTFDENSELHTDTSEKVIKANNKTGGCNVNDSANSSDAVFQCPAKHTPFKFDYKKIFGPKCTDDKTTCIRKMFLAALDAERDEERSSLSREAEQPGRTYDKAIKKCAKKTFDEEVRKYEVANRCELDEANTESIKAMTDYSALTTFNAKNYSLMEKMLSEAFQYLRKDPRFVWAQLPDAHRIPLLREWIARRFGKVYTATERNRSFRMSCIIFRALQKSNINLKLPTAHDIGQNFFLDYNCRNHVERKVQHVRNTFYHHLDSQILDQTRIFWFAMRGYLCSLGPPRKSFFSYMPSRQQDIHHFRLWKTSEYRNYWTAWNSRRQKEEQENF